MELMLQREVNRKEQNGERNVVLGRRTQGLGEHEPGRGCLSLPRG